VNIFPNADNTFQLFEDDGETLAYEQGKFSLTAFNLTWQKKKAVFTIQPLKDDARMLSEERLYKLTFHAIEKPEKVEITVNGEGTSFDWHHRADTHQLVITDIGLPVGAELQVVVQSPKPLMHREDRRRAVVESMLKTFALDAEVKKQFHQNLDAFLKDPMLLVNLADRMEESHLLALIETWLGKQPEKIPDDPEEAFQRIVNRLYHG
jgi:hypothetical protein